MSASGPSPGDPAETPDTTDDERAPNTLFNALIGALISAITVFFIPFSPVFGGGIAGYLEGGDTNDGLKVGGLAGLVAAIPLFFIAVIVALFMMGMMMHRGILGVALLGIVLLVFSALYVVGLSTLGGAIGVYVKNEL
ncbi:MAG: hypothetical protein ACI8UR_000232 [Natronomonas sp.]|jgi:hypothetical protein|uniref:DUF5518 domain-containing protein n=1 Tax=Natronomonas sp. TaxID=2184060 RepID=UPI0039898F98